ncbi:hypothetical protein Hdeb2414_s0007g00251461 [Helianthus debilis subsp. tardiflorus]
MIILNVSELKEVTEGLVLPKILTNQIPRDCQVIKLVDYLGVKYKVAVENMGHISKKIHGSKWIRFLESYKHKNIEKLCLEKLKEAKFEVFVLSDEGFEIRKDGLERDYVHGCLDLLHGLMWLLSERRLKIDHLVAKVHKPKQSSKVDVCYVFPPENEKGLAAGFMGSGWTTFCFENHIEEGCQLLFQWMVSTPADHFNFNNIFNKNRVGLQVTPEHHCSRTNHRHGKRRPTYKKQVENHVTRQTTWYLHNNFAFYKLFLL